MAREGQQFILVSLPQPTTHIINLQTYITYTSSSRQKAGRMFLGAIAAVHLATSCVLWYCSICPYTASAFINFSNCAMQNAQQPPPRSASSESHSPPARGARSKDKPKAKSNIVINISDCQYPVVAKVAKQLGWRKQKAADTFEWDLCWTDNAVQPETLVRMELYQKINHFPAMYHLARKNLLGRALMRMRKQFPEDYDFFPLTWMLPTEYHEFKAYFQGKTKGKARTFIVKPESLSQGKGIFLTRRLEDINPTAHCVVQRYIHKPYLIQGLKFDLRVYVLVASVDPLTLYVYEQGLGRFATEEYQVPTRENMDQVCMHLTNYAINKDSPKFVFNQSEQDMSKGHKRSLTSVYQLLARQGVDTHQLKRKINDCIVKTMISGLPHLTSTYRSCQPESYAGDMCFELLGFDVLLNDQAEPVVLEINHTPSFTTDTPLDHHIKYNYIRDALTLLNVNEKTKHEIIRMRREACQQRVVTGKKVKMTQQDRDAARKQAVDRKLLFEQNNRGGFQRIYPTEQETDPYKKFIDYAEQVFQTMVGGKKARKSEKNEEITVPAPSKRKMKRQPGSTTPELFTRKPIADRKYDSKKSINTAENEVRDERIANNEVRDEKMGNNEARDEKESAKETPRNYPLLNFEKISRVGADYVSIPSATQKTQAHTYTLSITPQPRASSTLKQESSHARAITYKQKQSQKEVYQEMDLMRQFSSIRRFGSNRDIPPEKRFTKQKDRLFGYTNNNYKDKTPISLNTLLINGLDQQTNFLVGNLKRFLIGQHSRS